MKTKSRKLAFRRRREGLTDYALRTKLLRSRLPFLVVRSSNRYVYAQIVSPAISGDRTFTSASSRELRRFGWRLGTASTPAAYLVGYLIGLRASNLGISSAILNIGLSTPTKGNKAFAVVDGTIEAGLQIPRKEDASIPKERLYGKHIVEYIEKVRATGVPSVQFSKLFGESIDIEAEVHRVKEKMKSSFSKEGA
ncbi:MAG: 50S ribosomal protein L18 [Thermoproteota archaeon]